VPKSFEEKHPKRANPFGTAKLSLDESWVKQGGYPAGEPKLKQAFAA
jgi:hypothetical protein